MKIGITERGDAGIDLSWLSKMDGVDGVVLVTKNITDKFIEAVLSLNKPAIVHCTCTGHGATKMEPNVPIYFAQLDALKRLIQSGFPAQNCVLRIDPIIPNADGMLKFLSVLQYFFYLNTGVSRIRISVMDEYKHVKDRFMQAGLPCLYEGFQPSEHQLWPLIETLRGTGLRYEICAETRMYQLAKQAGLSIFEIFGCISAKDLQIMGLPESIMQENMQNRNGCHCLSCKTELLNNKHRCPHSCLYCYWRD